MLPLICISIGGWCCSLVCVQRCPVCVWSILYYPLVYVCVDDWCCHLVFGHIYSVNSCSVLCCPLACICNDGWCCPPVFIILISDSELINTLHYLFDTCAIGMYFILVEVSIWLPGELSNLGVKSTY